VAGVAALVAAAAAVIAAGSFLRSFQELFSVNGNQFDLTLPSWTPALSQVNLNFGFEEEDCD
jgi:hypothetical protein